MLQAMSPRGPDDGGVVYDQENLVCLGHKRLSIIDLSSCGRQPMTDSSGRFSITYNGEIYNYRELRRELERLGHVFRTQTDTEVLLVAYKEWGASCLERLRGMFAFAILDRGPKCGEARMGNHDLPDSPYVFLARDRFGIKPLLYTNTGDGFAFASELKAFMSAGLVKRTARPGAVVEYLSYGAISQPGTILEDVYHLEPGTAMYVSEAGGKLTRVSYWNLAEAAEAKRTTLGKLPYEELVWQTRKVLEQATAYHLVADVPVGAFLSGGVDSTAVCALMQRHTGRPIRTFSIGFKENTEVTDETSFAKKAADSIGCEHSEIVVGGQDIKRSFDAVIHALDQPSIDGTNTYLVSHTAGGEVKVALSGIGGDELFAGYPHFLSYLRAAGSKGSLWRGAAAALHRLRPNRFTLQSAYARASIDERLALMRNLAGPDRLKHQVARALVPFCEPYIHPAIRDGGLPAWDPVSQLSYAECRGYLRDTLLRDNDVMSMAHSLEVRPVLVDHELATHALALPLGAKVRDGQMKAALVDAVKDLVPAQSWNRPKKGFELPFATWMNGSLSGYVEEALYSESAKQVFGSAFLKKVQKQARAETLPRRAWSWLVLLSWMEQSRCRLG